MRAGGKPRRPISVGSFKPAAPKDQPSTGHVILTFTGLPDRAAAEAAAEYFRTCRYVLKVDIVAEPADESHYGEAALLAVAFRTLKTVQSPADAKSAAMAYMQQHAEYLAAYPAIKPRGASGLIFGDASAAHMQKTYYEFDDAGTN